MAITGRFEADFTQFSAAVDSAEVKLRSFETGSAKVESALSKMTNAFSGRKIIQDATLMVEAVERLGGTSKLTESELARLGTVAAEAVEKMKALGIEVPASLEKVAAAAKQVAPAATQAGAAMQSMTAQFADANKLLAAFGVGVSVAGVVSFGREVLAAGDHIQKMADQTNLSIAAVQRFQFIAGQSGSSMDSLVGAVQTLQQKLGDNDKGLTGALASLNINLAAFKQLNAYEQMTTLAEAVRAVEDPTARANLAASLFGKTWKEILPAILGGMREVGDQAPIMADDTVKSLDRIGDQMQKTRQQIVTWGGSLITAIETVANTAADAASAFSPEHFGHTSSWLLKYAAEINDPSGLLRALDAVPPATNRAATGIQALSLSAEEATRIEREMTDQVKESIEAHKEEAAAYEKEQAALEALIEARKKQVSDIGAGLFGAKDIEAAQLYADAIGTVSEATRLSTVNREGAQKAADILWKGEQALIIAAADAGVALPPVVELYEKLRIALTANAQAELADAQATAANTAEKKRLNEEMERAYKASGGTDIEGFRGGMSGTGQSPMAPSVGLKPSVFAAGGIAGVNTPGTYNTNVNVSGVLLSNNPSAREELRSFMSEIIGDGVKLSRKISPF